MQDDSLAAVESLCYSLYNPASPQTLITAQTYLDYSFPTFRPQTPGIKSPRLQPHDFPSSQFPLQPAGPVNTPAESAYSCMLLLQRATSPYTQMFSLSRLKNLVEDHFVEFPADFRVQLRQFILHYTYTTTPSAKFIVQQLAQLFAIITKTGWASDESEGGGVWSGAVKDLGVFLEASPAHRYIGTHFLISMVEEMGKMLPGRNSVRQRKTATQFRDEDLMNIIKLAIDGYKTALGQQFNPRDHQQSAVIILNLDLVNACLSYDFLGTNPDESGDDANSLQIPTSWKPLFEDGSLMNALLQGVIKLNEQGSAKALSLLVAMACIRRSLFTEPERQLHIERLISVMTTILTECPGKITPKGGSVDEPAEMDDGAELNPMGPKSSSEFVSPEASFHEFCRLLARFRGSFVWSEVMEAKEVSPWLRLAGNWSVARIWDIDSPTNGIQYLLLFWSKMVAGARDTTSDEKDNLANICIQLVKAFVTSRVEKLLMNKEMLLEMLEFLASVARFRYEETSEVFLQVMEPVLGRYQALLRGTNNNPAELPILVNQFTWIVHIIAAFVGGRTIYLSSEVVDFIDGKLSSHAIQIMNASQQLLTTRRVNVADRQEFERLELAFMHFWMMWRKSYGGDGSINKTSTVYTQLTERCGIADQDTMLDFIVQKLASNLSLWGNSEDVTKATVDYFLELASGYSNVRQLRKMETAQFMLNNHSSVEQFGFLRMLHNMKVRMKYYNALSRLVWADDDTESKFYDFVKPFDDVFDDLANLDCIQAYQQDNVRIILEGIFRDLRGFAEPITSKSAFALFQNWLIPDRMPIFLHALEAYRDLPISTQILKLFAEMSWNKSNRLDLDSSNADGIMLFRETSRVLMTFAQSTLTAPISGAMMADRYVKLYKGICLYFKIVTRALTGKYVNFAVSRLYNDKSLDDTLAMCFQLMLLIPVDDLFAFPKLTQSYFALLDVLSLENLMNTTILDPNIFLYFIKSCVEGVRYPEVCQQACSSIDHMVTFVINRSSPPKNRHLANKPHWLVQYFQQFFTMIRSLFITIFELVLTGDKTLLWNLSRPFLGLVILNQEYLLEYSQRLVQAQVPEHREAFSKSLSEVMDSVDWTLVQKNRDRFSQNLAVFRREVEQQNLCVRLPSLL